MKADISEIRTALDVLITPGGIAELRIPKTKFKTVSGYFRDLDLMAASAQEWSGQGAGVYFTLNPIDPQLYGRCADRVEKYAELTTSDSNVIRRRWVPFDVDPTRPSGVSSTDEQHQAALDRLNDLQTWLAALGVPPDACFQADSGNGAHLLVRIDEPADRATDTLIERCLQAVDFHLSDERLKIDTSVHNRARVWKLPGTVAAKGDDLPELPHRRSRILRLPKSLAVAPRSVLDAIAAKAPEPAPAGAERSTGIDVERYIGDHGLSVVRSGPWNAGAKWILNPCPIRPEHTDNSAYIVRHASGAVSFGCHHDSCSREDWHSLRDQLEPGWRDHRNGHDKVWISGFSGLPHIENPENPESCPSPSFKLTSLAGLLAEAPESTAYVVDDLLAADGMSILAAKPKVGKSTLARELALCVARGEPFLGRETHPGTVIYLALEEKRSEVARHFARMGAADEPIHIHTGSAPEEAIPALAAAVAAHHPTLVIIDPLFRLVRVRDANDYAVVTRALEPVLNVARLSHTHVLLVHHMGKGERSGGDALLGSTAIFGAVDAALMMRKRENLRIIESTQRYGVDLPETIVSMDADTGRISAAGALSDAMLKEYAGKVLDTLGGESLTEKDLKEQIGGNRTLVSKAIRYLVEFGQVGRNGAGVSGNPYTYHVANPGNPENPPNRENPDDDVEVF